DQTDPALIQLLFERQQYVYNMMGGQFVDGLFYPNSEELRKAQEELAQIFAALDPNWEYVPYFRERHGVRWKVPTAKDGDSITLTNQHTKLTAFLASIGHMMTRAPHIKFG